LDEEALKCAMNKVLDARQRISDEKHDLHHAWVERCIERDRRRRALWDRVSVHVLGWGALAAIIGFVSLIGESLLEALRNLLKAKGGP
jgi:hypothetical protein